MSYPVQAVTFEVVEKVEKQGNKDHVYRLLQALKLTDEGNDFFRESRCAEAVKQHEAALDQLRPVPEADIIRGVIQSSLIAEYATINRDSEAVTAGREAVKRLADDPRLKSLYGQALHDLGGALVQSGQYNEGISYFEQALKIFEKMPDGASRASSCRRNLERVRSASGLRSTPAKPNGLRCPNCGHVSHSGNIIMPALMCESCGRPLPFSRPRLWGLTVVGAIATAGGYLFDYHPILMIIIGGLTLVFFVSALRKN